MENNTYAKPMYRCALCDTIYDNIAERTQCEQSCLKRKAEAEKREALAKKNEEKRVRKEEVDNAVANAFKLINAFIRDFGPYEYDTGFTNDCIWPSKFWHYFG